MRSDQEGNFAIQAEARAQLTWAEDKTPVVVRVRMQPLSGPNWCARFPGSRALDDLETSFKERVVGFLKALRDAGANVVISATLRPPQRAFLMHWSWRIAKQGADPRAIPRYDGIDIKWDHPDQAGSYSREMSVAAAQSMVNGFGINRLRVAPALKSRHIEGKAIDMSIEWEGTLAIAEQSGKKVTISSSPRTGMNTALHAVGRSYGVTKFFGGEKDRPHWSTDGR